MRIRTLTPGWATFGQVLPQGAARGPLQVGNLPTQTDKMTHWPDGSIRFAVLTAHVPAAGAYPVTEGDIPPLAMPPISSPNVAVWVRQGSVEWGVRLYELPTSANYWLAGGNVVERRYIAPFTNNGGEPHPHLRCVLDVRYYRDGGVRVSVCVENCLDVAGAGMQAYSLRVLDGSTELYAADLTHPWLTRYRLTFHLGGLQEAFVLPDWAPAVAAGAVPQYPATTSGFYSPVSFPPLSHGWLNPDMPATGGRPEIAPYPDWAARTLGGDGTQLSITLAHGNNPAGAFPVHIRNDDGRFLSIDDRPRYWLDTQRRGSDGPLGDVTSSPLVPDNAHQPSLAYVPYLATGDRYYVDEMADWANYVLLSTNPEWRGNTQGGDGSLGLLYANETRGIAWGLRNLTDAAAYLPDIDPRKAYFAAKVTNNLAWADTWARDGWPRDHGVAWHGMFWDSERQADVTVLWMHDYAAWAIRHAHQQGFTGGADWLRQIVNFHASWLMDPTQRRAAAPYRLPIGAPLPTADEIATSPYWLEARLLLTVAEELGVAGAAAARAWVETFATDDLVAHPGFHALPGVPGVPTVPDDPTPPDPEIVVYPIDLATMPVDGGSFRLGLTVTRPADGLYRLCPGQPFGVRAGGLGLEGVQKLVDLDDGQPSTGWPHSAAFVFPRPGVRSVLFSVPGHSVDVPVLVEGPLPLKVGSTTVLASTTTGPVSDNTVGLDWDVDNPEWWTWYFSGDPWNATLYRLSGPPDDPFAGPQHLARITGSPYTLTFGGPCHRDSESGLLLMACLGQWGARDGGGDYNYGDTFLAVSSDGGRNFRYAGVIARHAVTPELWRTKASLYGVHSVGGSGLLCLPGTEDIDYLYSFPPHLTGETVGAKGDVANLVPNSLVRAPLRAVCERILAGGDVTNLWQRFYQGRWDESALGGRADPVIPFGGYAGAQVQWCSHINSYLALVSAVECSDRLFLTWAPALTGPWSPPQLLWREERPGFWFGGAGFLNPGGQVGDSFRVGVPCWQEWNGGEIQLAAFDVTLE